MTTTEFPHPTDTAWADQLYRIASEMRDSDQWGRSSVLCGGLLYKIAAGLDALADLTSGRAPSTRLAWSAVDLFAEIVDAGRPHEPIPPPEWWAGHEFHPGGYGTLVAVIGTDPNNCCCVLTRYPDGSWTDSGCDLHMPHHSGEARPRPLTRTRSEPTGPPGLRLSSLSPSSTRTATASPG